MNMQIIEENKNSPKGSGLLLLAGVRVTAANQITGSSSRWCTPSLGRRRRRGTTHYRWIYTTQPISCS